MILVMRNEVDEFVPGHDWTVVRLDAALVGRIAARARACRAMREADPSLAEARYVVAVGSAPPAPTPAPPAAPATNPDDLFTVNIPNSQGTYTAVTLRRSGNGFVGPQGEFYTEFPRVEQLKAMYGK